MQYKTRSAPMKLAVNKSKDLENAVSRYADILNFEAKDGWELVSIESLPVESAPGCFGLKKGKTVFYNMITYKKDGETKQSYVNSSGNVSGNPPESSYNESKPLHVSDAIRTIFVFGLISFMLHMLLLLLCKASVFDWRNDITVDIEFLRLRGYVTPLFFILPSIVGIVCSIVSVKLKNDFKRSIFASLGSFLGVFAAYMIAFKNDSDVEYQIGTIFMYRGFYRSHFNFAGLVLGLIAFLIILLISLVYNIRKANKL